MGKKKQQPDIFGIKDKSGYNLCDNQTERLSDSWDTGFRHSTHYHDYFRGYTEIRVNKPNGKYKTERYYTASWVKQDVTYRQYVQYRILYAFLVLAACALYVWAMSRPNLGSNVCVYVAVPGFLSAIGLFISIIATAIYIASKRKMTKWGYKAGPERLKKIMPISGLLLAATGLAVLIYVFINPVSNIIGEVVSIAADFVAASGLLAVYIMEKNMKYADVENDTVLPEGEKHEIW